MEIGVNVRNSTKVPHHIRSFNLPGVPDLVTADVVTTAVAGDKELILSAIIAQRTGRDIGEIYAGKSASTSWGHIANMAGIIPMDVDDLLKQMVLPAK